MSNRSLRDQRIELHISTSSHGLALGSSPYFQKPANILDWGYHCVIGTHDSTTTTLALYSRATGYWSISHSVPLWESISRIAYKSMQAPSRYLVISQPICYLFVPCMICHLIVGFVSEVVARMHVGYLPLHQRMHFHYQTYQLRTWSLRAVGIQPFQTHHNGKK